MWCLDSFNPLWRRGWELYGRLYRARGICTDMASRVVSGIIQSLFSGSRKVCDIFVDSGMAMDAKCAIHALICDVTFEHHGEPRVQTNVRVGIIAAQNIIEVSAVVALSYVI